MKNILFVINSLTIGGSEKSLVSLLNCIDYNKYQVDLLMFKKGGDFEKYIPSEVNVLEIPDYYKFISGKKHKFKFKDRVKYSLCRLSTSINLRTNKKIQSEQIIYKHHKNVLKSIGKNYDVAVAYSQGYPTYFVADKINAKKKMAWINCDYANTGYDKNIDELFYEKFDKIIAVSETIQKSIIGIKPKYESKMVVIKDIVNPMLIKSMAEEESVFEDKSYINILTVARLVIHHKGYDIAVKAAKILKDSGYKFKWYVVGEGEHRKEIESLIMENDLKDTFILLGKKQNPYPYMENCDLYVQPSRKEGFGLTVAEAKILRRPIVCTNFNTANELICNYEDGLIVGMDEKEVYLGIKKYIEDTSFKEKIENNLKNKESYSSISEIEKIYNLIES